MTSKQQGHRKLSLKDYLLNLFPAFLKGLAIDRLATRGQEALDTMSFAWRLHCSGELEQAFLSEVSPSSL
jgi:hypothetical protein